MRNNTSAISRETADIDSIHAAKTGFNRRHHMAAVNRHTGASRRISRCHHTVISKVNNTLYNSPCIDRIVHYTISRIIIGKND